MPAPSRPSPPPAARRLTQVIVLRHWGLSPKMTEDAVLLVSELVGNAVRHTGARVFGLRMRRRRGWIRVEVTPPAVCPSDAGPGDGPERPRSSSRRTTLRPLGGQPPAPRQDHLVRDARRRSLTARPRGPHRDPHLHQSDQSPVSITPLNGAGDHALVPLSRPSTEKCRRKRRGAGSSYGSGSACGAALGCRARRRDTRRGVLPRPAS